MIKLIKTPAFVIPVGFVVMSVLAMILMLTAHAVSVYDISVPSRFNLTAHYGLWETRICGRHGELKVCSSRVPHRKTMHVVDTRAAHAGLMPYIDIVIDAEVVLPLLMQVGECETQACYNNGRVHYAGLKTYVNGSYTFGYNIGHDHDELAVLYGYAVFSIYFSFLLCICIIGYIYFIIHGKGIYPKSELLASIVFTVLSTGPFFSYFILFSKFSSHVSDGAAGFYLILTSALVSGLVFVSMVVYQISMECCFRHNKMYHPVNTQQ